MTTQRKPVINLYVHEHTITEQALDADYSPIRHGFSHPDCHIKIWRGDIDSISGKQGAIRHCVLTALIAAGISLAALRDHKAAKKRATTEIDPAQKSLL